MRVSPIVALATAAFVTFSFDANSADWPRVEGTFAGEIEGNGEKLKSETRLNVHDATVAGAALDHM
jgi:hypothetical protein